MLAESSKEIHATVPIDRFVPKGDKLKMGIRIAKLVIQMLSDTFVQARLAWVPSRRPRHVVAKALIKTGKVQFVVEQVV